MRAIVAVGLAVWLCACSAWPAGKDPKGLVLNQSAETVLAALNRYIQANGKAPETLQALVPRYLAALPAQPEFNYSARRGTLVFNYAPNLPTGGTSACEARFGETAFRCTWYR